MPISAIDGLGADHWLEVKSIIQDAVTSIIEPKFSVKLVSDADDVGVIHKRIVHGVYSSDIVVCDVSARNANVMFELGMRLAFDKPTIIIKDDKTDYAFDTSVIEHLAYPRDLRFSKITAFKKLLADKVAATYHAAKGPGHSTFLKNFGTFKIAEIDQKTGTSDQLVIEALQDLQQEVSRLRYSSQEAANSLKRRASSKSFTEQPELNAVIIAVNNLLNEHPNLDVRNIDAIRDILVKDESIASKFKTYSEFSEAVRDACVYIKKIAGIIVT